MPSPEPSISRRFARNLSPSFEACLLTDPQKSRGAILVNRDSSVERRRYSIAHELGHFLNERHRPTADEGFRCSLDDLRESQSIDRHRRQEAEANRFAIELLAPAHLVRPHLGCEPDLAQVLAMAQALTLSREAAARRYVALQGRAMAIVFSRAGLIRYVEKSAGSPRRSSRSCRRSSCRSGSTWRGTRTGHWTGCLV